MIFFNNLINFNKLNKNIILSLSLFSIIITTSILYKEYCIKLTFNHIDKNYKQKEVWEKELEIYSISMPKFYTNSPKKKKCILFIGGYKDIPFVWNEIQKYFIKDQIDFFAPRTFGNGRSFYQIVSWKDWIITYLEAIHILENQYETIDIIGFSTGSVIAVYLSQFNYNCKIDNLFLCSPFLLYKEHFSIDLFFSNNIFSKIINIFFSWFLRFHIKTKNEFVGYRDTFNEYYSKNDYCEIFGDLIMETQLFNFVRYQFKPKHIQSNNIVILIPNHDNIIGDTDKQFEIIKNLSINKQIELITIPSKQLEQQTEKPMKCGHVMFKEKPQIIKDIYDNIKKFI